MNYLVCISSRKPYQIAHFVHEVNGVTGALCSRIPKPAVGKETKNGRWELVSALPAGIKVCQSCQKRKHKLDNPLPARVEKELAMLARLDPRAAALQREKMLAKYSSL